MKVYQKNADYSYTLGVFPTIQLLKSKPKIITKFADSMGEKIVVYLLFMNCVKNIKFILKLMIKQLTNSEKGNTSAGP